MSKYSKELKLAAINHYLASADGFQSTADHFQVDCRELRTWVYRFRIHNQESLTRCHTRYPALVKLQILECMARHKLSINQTLARFNIASSSTIRVWQRLYNEGGLAALQAKPKGRPSMSKPFKPFVPTNKPVTQMTPEELMQELEYRRLETDYLKKLEALTQQKHLVSKNKSK